MLVAACGGRTEPFGRAAGPTVQFGDAQASSSPPLEGADGSLGAPPALPAARFPDLPDCSQYQIVYSGFNGAIHNCATETCPTPNVACGTTPSPTCGPVHGCVQSISAPGSCPTGWWYCAVGSCASVADCANSKDFACLFPAGAADGLCWPRGLHCVNAADCFPGQKCVAADDGTRWCLRPNAGRCNRDDECTLGRCVLTSGSIQGECSTGNVSAFCFADRDWAQGLRASSKSAATERIVRHE